MIYSPRSRSRGPTLQPVVKSAERTMLLFEYLAEHGPATYATITRALGLPNSSGYQLVQTAVSRSFIEFDPATRTYAIGSRLWEVAQAYSADARLVAAAQPVMDRLRNSTKETVQLARLSGLDNVYLAIAESPHPMKLISAVGTRLASHGTGLGKVLLAGLDDAELRERLHDVTLARFTDRTITDTEQLLKVIDEVRVQGYGEDREEYVVGCRCIAIPIKNGSGATVAAMSVSIPTPRFNADLAAKVLRELREAVDEVGKAIGG
ncbi:IclR family transcriptional regulator [Jiangella asiatica]|nr:IclR family transcriptional regulator [Jiangella asiatica]